MLKLLEHLYSQMTMVTTEPRLLFIDSYDSFTFNLAALCRRAIPGCHIHIIKNNDLDITSLRPLLPYFSAIIVGPGPGSPDNPADVGVVKDLWHLPEDHLLPIFGVCLGLQSMCIEFGGTLKRLDVVKHGQISEIIHNSNNLFEGVGSVHAVRYHSLHADPHGADDIEPLAWADDGLENGRVLMGAAHKHRPFWGVQYHPESVRTEGGGIDVVRNFWTAAQRWNSDRRRFTKPWNVSLNATFGSPWPKLPSSLPTSTSARLSVLTESMELPSVNVAQICETLKVHDESSPFVLLESAAAPGRFSILTCSSPGSTQFVYNRRDDFLTSTTDGKEPVRIQLSNRDIWSWLATFMSARRATGGTSSVPFWGGLVGILGYELAAQNLDVQILDKQNGTPHPDVNLLYVERSVVLDHQSGTVYIQSLIPDDQAWIATTRAQICSLGTADAICSENDDLTEQKARVFIPDKASYLSGIQRCIDFLHSGDSYELCLTAQTRVQVPRSASSWSRYNALRKKNPAPYSAYIRLSPTTFLSSSPERFLSYSAPPHSLCQLRPIKGTVPKTVCKTRAQAEEALVGSTKEVAENLMIVDLIRHDLHGVVGDHVEVKQFCGVEEYKTVWQMVSVIEGQLPETCSPESQQQLGWEVLRRSLPPGSMTGAPKKRSVEILQNLESHDRGLYSGVFGYWSVSGAGDWAVAIRSCFKHDDQDLSTDEEEWRIGAGGAITALSDPEAEWEEMLVKLNGVLRSFNAQVS